MMVFKMLLAVDIGNTNIKLGFFRDKRLIKSLCVAASEFQQEGKRGKGLWAQISMDGIDDIVVASVNPTAEAAFYGWLKNRCNKTPLKIGVDIQPTIPIRLKRPDRVGIDRVVNAVAAYHLINDWLIVVDVGTAITFDVVSDRGEYLGGVIAPGMNMSANAMHTQTAQLPLVEAAKPDKVLGKDTKKAMISGIYWGCVGSIRVILERLFDELERRPAVVATGGDAALVARPVRYIKKVVPHLTLNGIMAIYMERQT